MDQKENYPFESENAKSTTQGEGFQLKYYISITALFVLLAVLITFIVTYAVLTAQHQEETDKLKQEHLAQLDSIGEFKTIAELYNSLPEEVRNFEMYKKLAYIDYFYRTSYAGEIDEEQLVYMIASGYILGTGDTYGNYYSADELDAVLDDSQGNSVGIGVYVTYKPDIQGICISYVMKDGPANKIGLLPGDVVTHVEGESVAELGYYVAIDKIKGEENTPVKLTYVRDGISHDVSIIRQKITVESVIYKKHETDPTVGVIRIIEFNNSTPAQFEKAVEMAIKVDGCKSLVYDLRGNPGGTLTSVVEMLDFLLPSGTLVTVRYADNTTQTHSSDDKGNEFEALYGKDIKMAVLTNGYTASAAELFTCALKDYKKAVIVGEKTYGKGCGQNIIPLPDGTGLAFTTFLYDPPKSANYNGVGIVPDKEQALSEEASKKNIFELKHDEDDQLKAALDALK